MYAPGSAPQLGMLVHTLEHGRINVQYKPGTPAETVAQLEALLAEQSDGYHMLLYENTTGMDAQVAATTWGHSLTCPEMNDKVFDAHPDLPGRVHRPGPGGRSLGARRRGRASDDELDRQDDLAVGGAAGEQAPRDLALLAAAAGGRW